MTDFTARFERIAVGVAFAAAAIIYLPTLGYGFTNYDDRYTIVDLPIIRDLSPAGLVRMFTPLELPSLPEYMPVKNLTYAVDYALFGLWAPGFRVQQLLWYAASIAFTWLWLRAFLRDPGTAARLGLSDDGARRIAATATVLFAVHPAHVESVAWLSCRKDVLAGTFMPWAALVALRLPAGFAPGLWGLAALTALALLSKPMAVALIVWIVAADLVRAPAGGVTAFLRSRAAVYVTVVVPSVAFLLFYTARFAEGGRTTISDEYRHILYAGPAWARLPLQAAWFARASILPAGLAPAFPPRFLPDRLDDPALIFGTALGVAVLAITVVGVLRRNAWGFAGMVLLGSVGPILASPPWGQYVAGRYLYHGLTGALVLVAWYAERLYSRSAAGVRAYVGPALLASVWAVSAADYRADWRDSASLWAHAVRVNPAFAAGWGSMGDGLVQAGRPAEAERAYRTCLALDLDPKCATGLATLMLASGRDAQVEAVVLPTLARDMAGDAHHVLSGCYLKAGRGAEALALWRSFLEGRRVSDRQIRYAMDAALAVGDRAYALELLSHLVRARHGGLPPPLDDVNRVAQATGDEALAKRAAEAAEACVDSACFAARLTFTPAP